eukprot:gene9415-10401_t
MSPPNLSLFLPLALFIPSTFFPLLLLGYASLAFEHFMISVGTLGMISGIACQLGLFNSLMFSLLTAVFMASELTYLISLHYSLLFDTAAAGVPSLRPLIFVERRYFLPALVIVWYLIAAVDLLSSAFCFSYLFPQLLASFFFSSLLVILCTSISHAGLRLADSCMTLIKEMNYKSSFVRYISHEVRSPLTTSKLALDCLVDLLQSSRGPSCPEEALELAMDCRTTCLSAIHTLNDLLLYDKVEERMLSLDCANIPCFDFLMTCIHPLENQIKLAGIFFETHVEKGARQAMLSLDQHKMEQVLRNYISNAIKFTPCGGHIDVYVNLYVTPPTFSLKKSTTDSCGEEYKEMPPASSPLHHFNSIQKSPSQENTWVRVTVTDTGPGVAQENQDKLFGQYVQFDAHKLQKGGGSGLGLWLSKAITEAHGGRVGMYSEGLGHGSCFYFDLPVCALQPLEDSHTQTSLKASPALEETTEPLGPSQSNGYEYDRDSAESSWTPWSDAHYHGSKAVMTPQLGASSTAQKPPLPLTLAPEDEVMLPTLRILIADDTAVARKLVEKLLLSISAPRSNNPKMVVSRSTCYGTPLTGGSLEGSVASSVNSNDSPIMLNTVNGLMGGQRSPSVVSGTPSNSQSSCAATSTTAAVASVSALHGSRFTFPAVHITVDHAPNGQVCVDKVAQSMLPWRRAYNILLVDYYMPVLDGEQAIREVRKMGFTGLIFALTAAADNKDDYDRLIAAGATTVMIKPFDVLAFQQLVVEYDALSTEQPLPTKRS